MKEAPSLMQCSRFGDIAEWFGIGFGEMLRGLITKTGLWVIWRLCSANHQTPNNQEPN
ncbi:MAG: hypothetical protein WAV95_12235 [Azonexus sp.]